MSLRLRLTLAFMALVSLLLVVGITSYSISERVEDEVGDLLSSRGLDLRSIDLRHVGLEIEGFWDPSGSFIANDVEVLPGMRNPKLRGEIESIDASQRSVSLFGLDIRVRKDAEFNGGHEAFADLRPGQRIEASCRVVGGRWFAYKVQTQNIKATDKIKGTVSKAELDGRAPETLEFYGLTVSLAARDDNAPRNALRRIVLATQMALAIQEALAAAHEVVGRPPEEAGAGAAESQPGRLALAAENFGRYLNESRSDGVSALPLASARWRRPLLEAHPVFESHVRRFQELMPRDANAARTFLYEEFAPFLEERLLPIVYAYLSEAEETLGDQVRSVAARTKTTAQIALVTTALAAVLALVLGLQVWRSIHRPIRALHAAALRLGEGNLDTSVEISSRDEFGVLATAFNTMARDLATTTVSVTNLESVLAEKELLLREVHHRVKNNLQVISSLLAMQSSQVTDPETVEKLQDSQSRIRSMALIHELLYRNSDLAEIDMLAYLELLTSTLVRSASSPGAVEVKLDVADVAMDVDRALSTGLIVNELVTNSLKHAFEGDGVIDVGLSEDHLGRLVLRVADNGKGMGDDPRVSELGSLGLSLVRTLVRQFDGDLHFNCTSGTEVRVVFPAGGGSSTDPDQVAAS